MTAQSEISQAPHMPAAFINALREEGTKAEAVEWLQKIWNERCQLERELNETGQHLYCTTCGSCGEPGCCSPAVCWNKRVEQAERHAAELERDVRKIAWEWAQGVTDAETAIRQLNRMFPIDDSAKSAA